MPYLFLYQIIAPLTLGETIDVPFILIRVVLIAVCEILFSLFLHKGPCVLAYQRIQYTEKS